MTRLVKIGFGLVAASMAIAMWLVYSATVDPSHHTTQAGLRAALLIPIGGFGLAGFICLLIATMP